jgi:hypothetical protein
MSGKFEWIDGKMFSAPDEVVVDDRQAGDQMLSVGSPCKSAAATLQSVRDCAQWKGSPGVYPPLESSGYDPSGLLHDFLHQGAGQDAGQSGY